MKTVLALIDHPNLDIIIGPVLKKLLERNVNLKVLVMNAGRADYLIRNHIPYQTSIDIEEEFFALPGRKLFLNAADQNFPAHATGRKFDTIFRNKGFPSLTMEHSVFFTVADWDPLCPFSADKMAIIGQSDYDGFLGLGISPEKLVVTGFPPYDEYFEFMKNNVFVPGDYIWVAGCNNVFVSPIGQYTRVHWTTVLRNMYRMLLNTFPKLDILVKPHPAEPYYNTDKLYTDAIPPEFGSRVKIVDSKFSNIEGIFNSAFVLSFSGSVTFESILLKKKVIGFLLGRIPDCFKEAREFGAVIVETNPSNIAEYVLHNLENNVQNAKGHIGSALNVPNNYFERYLHRFDGKAAERVADAALKMMNDDKRVTATSVLNNEKSSRPVFKEIGFERYMRLMGIAEEVVLGCDGAYSILDIGSHDDFFMRFVPKANYYSYNGFISKNRKTPFDDNSYDIVVATDVLEHVPPEDRKSFILELLRLARQKVIFSFPTENAEDFEKFALTLVPSHRWLQEHIDRGLPKKTDVDIILEQTGIPYAVKPNHALTSWICSFLLEHTGLDINIKYRINEFLQANCFEMESREPAYRYIYTVHVPKGLDKRNIADTHEVSHENTRTSSVSIIIPVFNKFEYTAKCLEAIWKNTPVGYNVVIIDNASTDGTKAFLQALAKKNVTVITNETNLGFAKACNQGAQAASTEYILFLNNDTTPLKGWLEPLLNVAEQDTTVAAVGSKLLYPDGTIQHGGVVIIDDRRNKDPLLAKNNHVNKPADAPEANKAVLYQALTAACLLIRKEAFQQAGAFDEGYWNGYEDVDLCFKLQDQGKKIVYQPASVVLHHESKSGPERFVKAQENIARLHNNWLGKIKPDLILNEDGSITVGSAGKIQPYNGPLLLKENQPIATLPPVRAGYVSMVILTFNQLEYTKKCVKSIEKQTPEPHEIIFVDNGSTDGTVKWLKARVKENKNYKLIENKQNLGFAKGCNQGIKASKGEYVLLLNNDVIVSEGWLSGLLDCLNHSPDTGIVGPMTNNISGPQQVISDEYRSVDNLGTYAAKFRNQYRHRRIPLRRIVGFCMLFRYALAEQIGMLDESFGTGNFEDDDFCLRSALAGYKNYIAGDVFIHHYGSRSFMGNKIDYSSSMSGNIKIFEEKWTGLDLSTPLGKKISALNSIDKAGTLNHKGGLNQAIAMLIEGIKYTPEEKEVYYQLAEILFDSKLYKDALDTVDSIPSVAKEDLRHLEIVAYCREALGEPGEYVDQILEINKTSASALNLKGIIAHKQGDDNAAEGFFLQAIESDPGYGEPYTNRGMLKWAMGAEEEALHLLEKGFILSPTMTDNITLYHSAITELGQFARAEALARDAKTLHPENKRILFFLIDILIKQHKFDMAMSEIEKAMLSIGIDDGILAAALEIRNKVGIKEISKAENGRSTLSLCMIVKNEEQHLARCLLSVKPAVDEMIVVDTGSTDKTKDIARAYGARVFDFPWTDDFSAARNHSLSLAAGDWILVLDADEVISSLDYTALDRIVRNKPAKPVAYSMVTRNYTNEVSAQGWTANDRRYRGEEDGTGWFPSLKVRLFTKDERIRFRNPVHELVEASVQEAGIKIKASDIPVHHYGRFDKDKLMAKGKKYFLLGKQKIEQMKGDVKALKELAIQASELGEYEAGVALWKKIIDLDQNNAAAFLNISYAYLRLEKYQEALISSRRALELEPTMKEAALNYAGSELIAGDISKTISVLETLLHTHPDYPPAMALVAAAYYIKGQEETGLELFEKLRKRGFNCTEFLDEQYRGVISQGKLEQAISLLEVAVKTGNISKDTHRLLAECQGRRDIQRV